MRTISKNLTLCLKELEKEGQIKAKVSRRKEIIRMRAEINGNRNRKIVERINETKSCFFENIKLINTYLDYEKMRRLK